MNTVAVSSTSKPRILFSYKNSTCNKNESYVHSTRLWKSLVKVGSGVGMAVIIGQMTVFSDAVFAAPLELNVGKLFGDGPTPAERLRAAEEQFQSSDLLKELKKKTEENREKNQKAIEAKYCLRQAQLGIGDCGDLKDIPDALNELQNIVKP